MRVLITTTPGCGHRTPMLPLAAAFIERGHDVLWAAYGDVGPQLERKGFAVVSAGLAEGATWDAFLEERPDVFRLPPAERPDHIFPGIFGARRAGPMLTDLLPVARDWRPDLLVCEQAEFAGPIVAAALGVPNLTHAFGRLIPAVRTRAAGETVAPLWKSQGLEPRPYGGVYDHLYLDIYPPSLQSPGSGHLPEVQLVRPVAAAATAAPPPDLPEGNAPLVYVTFGTVFNDMDMIRMVVEALRDLDVRIVATVGPGNDPDALGEQPANVMVAQFIPQDGLLPHCSLVVSHAGSGTFLAALGAGLPQVLLPQAADQFGTAEAGVASGTAAVIPPPELSPAAIAGAAVRLLEDDA